MARGQLRIYLGAAPGVGKTFAMLNEGSRRHERGTDVVAGFVESHGRPRTQEAIGDVEVLPRRVIEHRGATFEEMDLDGLLARKPEVALVDELAHTNVPGSRNEKRWQDVVELLDAGIDVISTVNVQHLESVNDVVERITGVVQRETVPDDVVRQADQVELVDMTPEALRRRMAHGNIYPAERIDPALTNYFRPGNLAALRELALLWVADQVDEALEEYRERHGITEPWETRERVLVALTGAPGTEALIRRAARVAQRAHGDLLGVHVRGGEGLAESSSDTLEAHRKLLEDLGGEYHEVVGSDVAKALTDFARAENCTQLVLGASNRSRIQELLRGSIINRIIRISGGIDVHVISHDANDEAPVLAPRRRRHRAGGLSVRREIMGWALAVIALALVTAGLASLRDTVGLPGVLLIYMLVVVVVAVVGGTLPAIGAAVVAFLLANWYFTPPIHNWTISEAENVLALVVFVIVAAIVSTVVATSARRSADASRARAEAEILVRLAATVTADDPLRVLVAHLRTSFGLDSVAILRRADGTWTVETSAGSEIPTTPDQADVVDELAPDVVLALRGRQLTADDRRVLSAFGAQLAAALERTRLSAEAESASALVQTNELRTALLQAVSHDLRTPLAAIKASVSSLRQDDVAWGEEQTAEFLAAIEDQTDRLTTLVANLLDMSRLQAGVIEPQLRAVGFDEVVPAAVAGLGEGGASVDADLSETLPRVLADAALLERVIANLLENAVSVCPAEHRVRVAASPINGSVSLHIIDRGPGLARYERDRVFEPFQRSGDQRPATGVGLGLAVARGFVQAMQGELRLDDTPGGGLTAIVTLPASAMSADIAGSRVLVVDDEPQILRALAANLRARGYAVDLAASGEEALVHASDHPPDLVVLDLGLPGISGIEVIAGLRGWSAVPIVVLSARDSERDKIDALDAGADDYVTKPFGMGELLARIRAALRRDLAGAEVPTIVTADFAVDLSSKRVTRPVASGAEEVRLTPTEWGMVEVLVRNAGKLVGQRQLLQMVWGPEYGDETNYFRVHMAHIRRKLEPDPGQPKYFITEPGMGYRFEPGATNTAAD